MHKAARISIVIPTFNNANYLPACLASLAAQTFRDWTAVIVNNCSTDGTATVADSFAGQDERLRVVHCTEFLGQQANYNRAIALASPGSEFIKMVEADNLLTPRCLADMVAVAEMDPQIGLIAGYYVFGSTILGKGVPYGQVVVAGNDVRREHIMPDTRMYYLGTPSTVMYRAKALCELEPYFRPGLFYDDLDLCFRILADWDLGFVHEMVAFVRTDNQGLSTKFWQFDFEPAYRYFLARQYGREIFDHRQASEVIASLKGDYLRCLAGALLGGRSQAYWKFHDELFAYVGEKRPSLELTMPAVRSLVDKVLNPKATLERILRRRR